MMGISLAELKADQRRRELYQIKIKAPTFPTPLELSTYNSVRNEVSTPLLVWDALDKDMMFPKWVALSESGVAIGKCLGVVQTSPEELLAWMFLFDSNQSMAKHTKENGADKHKYPNKLLSQINDHHIISYSCRKLPPPLAARDWLTRNFWLKADEDTYVLIYKSVNNEESDFPQNLVRSTIQNVVTGQFVSMYEFKRLPFGQTRFKMLAKADIRGSVPKQIANRAMSGVLDSVRRSYEFFEKDEEIDSLTRYGEQPPPHTFSLPLPYTLHSPNFLLPTNQLIFFQNSLEI